MKVFSWKGTYNTPEISMNDNDVLSFTGKSIMEDAYSFYQPLIKKIQYYAGSSLTLEIDLKICNINSKKQIYKLLKTAKENRCIGSLKVIWMHDPIDEDVYDFAKELEMETGIAFEFLEYA